MNQKSFCEETTMSLSYVLLTSLLEKPSTGIELARRFDRSMGFFWHATHQQIYRELKEKLKKVMEHYKQDISRKGLQIIIDLNTQMMM